MNFFSLLAVAIALFASLASAQEGPPTSAPSAVDSTLNQDFLKASALGNVDEVRALLRKGAQINVRTENGYTALMLAAGGGKDEVVDLLLSAGARANTQANHMETALLLAAANGWRSAAESLINSGADFRATDTGLTPLMMAAGGGHGDVFDFLLMKGENVNAKQLDGWTVLMHAAVKGNRNIISMLLARGADATPRNKENGNTAAEIAEEYHHKEIADLIRTFEKKPASSSRRAGSSQ